MPGLLLVVVGRCIGSRVVDFLFVWLIRRDETNSERRPADTKWKRLPSTLFFMELLLLLTLLPPSSLCQVISPHTNTSMSISIGTRNLKFMQRGTQLPAASPTPQPQASNASSSDGGSRRTKPATIAQKLPQQEQQVEEEEEEWVLPSRVNRGTTRPSAFNKTQTPAGISSGTRTRVVRQDSSYLSFINGTGAEKRRSGGSSDESGSDSDDGKPRAGEQPKNGRMTFGLLPTAERVRPAPCSPISRYFSGRALVVIDYLAHAFPPSPFSNRTARHLNSRSAGRDETLESAGNEFYTVQGIRKRGGVIKWKNREGKQEEGG